MNRSERRIIEQVRNCYPRKRQYTLREAIHTLAQQGIIAYEAAQATRAPNIVNVWWTTPLTGNEVDIKPEYLVEISENLRHNESLASARIKELEQLVAQKDQEILTLRAELNRVHDEYTWLASRKLKPTKEIVMAKFDLDMQVEVGGVKLGSVIVHIDVPDTAFDGLATVYKEALPIIFGQIKRDVECRCAAHNGDKHPGTAM